MEKLFPPIDRQQHQHRFYNVKASKTDISLLCPLSTFRNVKLPANMQTYFLKNTLIPDRRARSTIPGTSQFETCTLSGSARFLLSIISRIIRWISGQVSRLKNEVSFRVRKKMVQISVTRTVDQVSLFNEVLHIGASHFKGESSKEKDP